MDKELITTLKKYKETYQSRLEKHLNEYDDYDEIHFIDNELYFYENCHKTANVFEHQITIYNEEFNDFEYKYLNIIEAEEIIEGSRINCQTENYDVKALIKVDGSFLYDGYNLKKCEQLKISFKKIIEFLQELRHAKGVEVNITTIKTQNKLKWHGTPLQLTELIKPLYDLKLISPELKQKDVFEKLRLFFELEDFNENDKLKDIRNRTNTPTPFLNILETTLNNWIENKK